MVAYCCVAIAPMRKENADPSEMVSQLLFGEVISILEVKNNWSFVASLHDHYQGWIDTKHYRILEETAAIEWQQRSSMSIADFSEMITPWGNQYISKGSFIGNSPIFTIGNDVFERKTAQPSLVSLSDFAISYLNTPYLWGGKNSMGIDCSGFSQQVLRAFSIALPRDAYQQAELGTNVSFEEQKAGDLAFFYNATGKITHVGIILEQQQIIHAAGQVRIDTITIEGIKHQQTGAITHPLTCIKRF